MGFKMTDILPPAGWLNVRQLETNEFATGGANGNMNEQAKSLAARSELLKQYAALPYESKTGGYALGATVKLDNGDIVKNTVDGNAVNPNVDMTGWLNIGNTGEVESIADLLAIPNPKNGNRVYVKSYYAGTNKGGGDFVYKSVLSATNDGIIVFNGWVRVFSTLDVSPLWAGAAGDGLATDTVAVQKTVEFCLSTKLNLVSNKQKYLVDQTILIPRNFDSTFKAPKKINLDFGNSEFILVNDTSLFESGYYNNGVLVSSYGQPVESQNSFEIVLSNFTATTQGGIYPESYLIRLQDWHQGTELSNVSTHVFKNFLQSRQNFYMKFTNLNASYSGGGNAGTRFHFHGDHNLCSMHRLVGVNSAVGYYFDGAVTAVLFSEVSIEGMTVGCIFDGYVYDISVENCYIENVDNVAFKFNSYVFSANFSNNYVNFVDHNLMYFVEYAPLPFNRITIESSNHFISMIDESRIIKTKEDVYGQGIELKKPKVSSANYADLLVDNNVFGKNITVNQNIAYDGLIGRVNNVFAIGNYSGRFTNGYEGPHGFKFINTSSSNLDLQTAITYSRTQRIYVNLRLTTATSGVVVAGEFIGGVSESKFFEFTDSGYQLSTKLNLSVVDGFVHIRGTFSETVTACYGEVRLI